MNSSSFINRHLIRAFIKPLFAIIALLLLIAPAAAQTTYPSVPNLRFTDKAGTLAWDAPDGVRYYDLEIRRNQILYSSRNFDWRV